MQLFFIINLSKCPTPVRDDETVKHYLIRYAQIVDGRGPVYFIARRTPFDTLIELIKHYAADADGLCTNLTQPCPEVERYRLEVIKFNQELFFVRLTNLTK